MGQSLTQISETLRDAANKAQLIYAFNGVGKTRLSREFRLLVQFTDNSTLSNEVVAEPTEPEKQTVKFLLDPLTTNFNYWKEAQNVTV